LRRALVLTLRLRPVLRRLLLMARLRLLLMLVLLSGRLGARGWHGEKQGDGSGGGLEQACG